MRTALGLLLFVAPLCWIVYRAHRKGYLKSMLQGAGIGLGLFAWVALCIYLIAV